MLLDVIHCGCTDLDNCACAADGGGCMNGFCFCTDGRLEFDERRCHPAFGKSENITSKCPIPCKCGCRSSEICGSDGRCYCPDGSLVVPVVNELGHLVGHNQTCPPISPGPDSGGNSTMASSPPYRTSHTSHTPFLVVVASVSFAFTLLILLTGLLSLLFHKRIKKQLYKRSTASRYLGSPTSYMRSAGEASLASRFPLQSMTDNDLYESAQLLSVDTLGLLGSKAVEQDRIRLLEQIGQGNFGKVFKGIYTKPNGEQQDVAVKIPRVEGRATSQIRDFVLEAQITTAFNHDNILSCLGISADESGAPWLLFEFMPYGDLAEVLRSNSGIVSLQRDDLPNLKMADLWWLSLQIARGMKYLGDQHFTHRDLAARNCLLGKNLLLKISDFGLTRDIYTNEYYKMGEQRMLPIRWMAPESIQFGRFDTKSDIWSYGIVLWEIFTFGKRPYFSYSNQEVATLVPDGKISLKVPEGCPDLLKSIMTACWRPEPDERTSFEDIISELEEVSQLFFHSNPAYGDYVLDAGDMSSTLDMYKDEMSPSHTSGATQGTKRPKTKIIVTSADE